MSNQVEVAAHEGVGCGASAVSAKSAPKFSRKMLEVGFATGLFLAVSCLGLSAYYLISFQQHANLAVTKALLASAGSPTANQMFATQFALGVHMYMAKILLLSCGIFSGLSFGFLGFSLFLIGVEGAIDANVETPSAFRLSVMKLAPGAFVIVCAVVLIGVCATGVAPTQMTTRGPVTVPEQSSVRTERDAEGVASAATNAVDARSPDEVGDE